MRRLLEHSQQVMMVGQGGNYGSSEKSYFKGPTEIPSVSLPQFHIPEST